MSILPLHCRISLLVLVIAAIFDVRVTSALLHPARSEKQQYQCPYHHNSLVSQSKRKIEALVPLDRAPRKNSIQISVSTSHSGGCYRSSRPTATCSALFSSGDSSLEREVPTGGRIKASVPANKDNTQILNAIAKLESDMQILDAWTGENPQLSGLEFVLLFFSVIAAGSGPIFFGGEITELLAPTAAAFCAAIGIGAEYTGKVAVADGKEVAAQAIQCAAEAETFLANAEREKAITPLCAGIGATSATISLLVPTLLDTIGGAPGRWVTEVYLFCPLVSVLAAAVASLALEETRQFSRRAVGIGNRRFARSGLVGRTWLSTTEQIQAKSRSTRTKWRKFAASVLPAPILGALVPGSFATKTVVVSALAAAESAYILAQAEYTLARATDAVALKARTSAVCDTYANQGARSAGLLPFTSALSTLCAAATAAIVELPLFETATSMFGVAGQVVTVSIFPALSALFAGAASVSKARCQVDAEAAIASASTLAVEYGYGEDKDEESPIVRPVAKVRELIGLSIRSTCEALQRQGKVIFKFSMSVWSRFYQSVILRRGVN